MYDTIHFWIDRTILQNNPYRIKEFLSNVDEYDTTKGYYIRAGLRNFSVYINDAGVSLKGSLSKFYFGNNIQSLSLDDTYKAIEMLSEMLNISLFDAKITRIDIGAVLITKYAPISYFKYFGNKRYFKRSQYMDNTLYYRTDKRSLAFYDKTIEAKKAKINIPDEYLDKNLLRYELRFTQRIAIQLKEKEITGLTLCNNLFFSKLISHWKNEYASIEKINSNQQLNYEEISTPKDAKEAFMSMLLVNEDISRIENYVNELKSNSTFAYPRDYTRLNKDLMNLLSNSSNNENKQIIELNEKIMML